uniref:Uncharacterized protein n=1 Tax=Chionoecetes opilio bacilliform virus TaxID=1825681 RepID=A0A1Q3DLV0_9VIRU|nr:hypothetical protein SCV_044 [Chionoecetes opilio bacilliform virus]
MMGALYRQAKDLSSILGMMVHGMKMDLVEDRYGDGPKGDSGWISSVACERQVLVNSKVASQC